MTMPLTTSTVNQVSILTVQRMLVKIDQLHLPISSRRDVEIILVRQVTRQLDLALPWQAGHGQRTAALAIAIGRIAGLSPEALHHLKLASLLHDIGLLTLPPWLLTEPASWDSAMYAAVQCHPRVGAELLAPFRFLREASVLIAHHHERWDGTGYPYGLRGAYIPLGARILSIADSFDAIDVPNVDSPDIRNRVAYRILRVAAGTQFDPDLIEACACYLAQKAFSRRMTPNDPHDDAPSQSLNKESP
ncbi:MAG TPA: HD domain-containing phosphohydrolase [Nitrospira sp.]|nr:HD domain-containing phosphohydrolase [Nitrospira sp.]